jgi:hypothetical protein
MAGAGCKFIVHFSMSFSTTRSFMNTMLNRHTHEYLSFPWYGTVFPVQSLSLSASSARLLSALWPLPTPWQLFTNDGQPFPNLIREGLPTIRELMATRAFIAHDLPEADLSLTGFC